MTITLADPVPDTPVVAPRRVGWLGPGVVGGVMVAWSALFSWLAMARHEHFLTHAFDMGQMTQVLWKLHHGHGDFSTVTGLSILGDHARLVMYPLSLLPTSIRLVLVLQAVALGSGAVPVFLMARRRAPDGWAALLAIVYLAYPSLQWVSLFDSTPKCWPHRSCSGRCGRSMGGSCSTGWPSARRCCAARTWRSWCWCSAWCSCSRTRGT